MYLDIFPVKKVAQLQRSAQDHWCDISDDLHERRISLSSKGGDHRKAVMKRLPLLFLSECMWSTTWTIVLCPVC